jgi:hypothetical protein
LAHHQEFDVGAEGVVHHARWSPRAVFLLFFAFIVVALDPPVVAALWPEAALASSSPGLPLIISHDY